MLNVVLEQFGSVLFWYLKVISLKLLYTLVFLGFTYTVVTTA